MMSPRWNRLLITGAAGRLGSQLRSDLRGIARVVRSADVRALTPMHDAEEVAQVDLSDMSSVMPLLEGVDAVVHFGAVMPQASWDAVLQANIVGTFNVFEAARQAGVRRIVFASSHHAIGMYDRTQRLDADSPPRPGNLYGLSKAFGEDLARMYYDKHGIDVACLRIGSCFPEPTDERMLATWLSHRDMSQLCQRCLQIDELGHVVVYGVSDNRRRWWSNEKASFLGFVPEDSADAYAESIAMTSPADARLQGRAAHVQGGKFTQLVP